MPHLEQNRLRNNADWTTCSQAGSPLIMNGTLFAMHTELSPHLVSWLANMKGSPGVLGNGGQEKPTYSGMACRHGEALQDSLHHYRPGGEWKDCPSGRCGGKRMRERACECMHTYIHTYIHTNWAIVHMATCLKPFSCRLSQRCCIVPWRYACIGWIEWLTVSIYRKMYRLHRLHPPAPTCR